MRNKERQVRSSCSVRGVVSGAERTDLSGNLLTADRFEVEASRHCAPALAAALRLQCDVVRARIRARSLTPAGGVRRVTRLAVAASILSIGPAGAS